MKGGNARNLRSAALLALGLGLLATASDALRATEELSGQVVWQIGHFEMRTRVVFGCRRSRVEHTPMVMKARSCSNPRAISNGRTPRGIGEEAVDLTRPFIKPGKGLVVATALLDSSGRLRMSQL